MSRQGQTTTYPTNTKQEKSRTYLGWTLALAAAIALVVVLINYHPSSAQSPGTSAGNPAVPPPFDNDDQKLLNEVAQRQPDLSPAYENSLREANSYISDARKAAQENPDDSGVQEHLRYAYHQKAVLYEMATVRSLE